jgi:membrane fusion protein (multidrug efflux system)
MKKINRPTNCLTLLTVALLASGCGPGHDQPAQAPLPAAVGCLTVQPTSVPITSELPGRASSVRMAEVRARVAGILLKRNFTEGADVKAGDVLFEIDPAPSQANYDSAKASLAKAEANVKQAQAKTDRYKKLVEFNAVSKQDYDTALATSLQADADVLAAKAALETAALNLGYTKVVAPISGRIGTAKVTEGALVGQNETTLLAVIQQLDPIYVDFPQSSGEYLKLKNELAEGRLQGSAKEPQATILLEDGREYREKGQVQSSEVTVDQSTGSVSLRSIFPNPQAHILPGMFVRVKVEDGVRSNVFLIPQGAVSRDAKGSASVLLVGADNKVEARPVTTDRVIGDNWMVTAGVAPGDKVIVSGLQMLRPGMVVKESAAKDAAPPALSANH